MISVGVEILGAQQLLGAFAGIEKVAENLQPVFEEVGEKALSDIRRRFAVGGPGWPALAPSTIKRKGNARILQDSRELIGSFEKGAGTNIFRISPKEAEFGSSDFKGIFHQTGTSRMPKRVIIDVTSEQEKKYAEIAETVLAKEIRSLGFEVS